jgi:hypothetical protein
MSNLPSSFGNFLIYDYTGRESSTTYALPFTPLTFVPKLDNESVLLSNKRIVWDFGDNTTTEAVTATHAYTDIGTYNVTCYLYDKNGESYQSTYSKDVVIKNYITDSLLIKAPEEVDYTITAGKFQKPFIITNNISWQNIKNDPNGNIPIVSYVSGGNCFDYFRDDIYSKRYAHLYPYFSTYLLLTGDENRTEYVEVSSFTTNTSPVYIKLQGNDIVKCNSTDIDAFFCGVEGSREVFFKTDVNTPGANLFFGYQPNTLKEFSNTSTVGVNIKVDPNQDYSKLSISSNGLDSEGVTSDIFNIGKIKFNNTKIGFVITVKDSENFTVKGIPQLTDVNITLTDGSISYGDVTFTQLNSLSSIPLGGFYKGYLVANIPGGAENVYIHATAVVNGVLLVGASNNFNIYPAEGVYKIAKKGEDIDFKQKFKEIAFQPLFIDKKILFDDFLGSIFGDLSSSQTSIGKATYEKIENFVNNNATLDYSNINQLEALLKTIDVDLAKFSTNNLSFPAEMGRLVNLLSINYSRLRGGINAYNTDFKTYGYLNNPNYGKNLGNSVSLDYYITPGVDLVAFEKFSGTYKRVNTFGMEDYTEKFWTFELSESPATITDLQVETLVQQDVYLEWSRTNAADITFLSNTPTTITTPVISNFTGDGKLINYNDSWGWGLILPPDGYGVNLENYYLFYEYKDEVDGTLTNNIINYNDSNTTLTYSNSSYNDWSKPDGIISNMLAKQLYDGLDLFL